MLNLKTSKELILELKEPLTELNKSLKSTKSKLLSKLLITLKMLKI
jgi:predicted nucleic acid-binding protein